MRQDDTFPDTMPPADLRLPMEVVAAIFTVVMVFVILAAVHRH